MSSIGIRLAATLAAATFTLAAATGRASAVTFTDPVLASATNLPAESSSDVVLSGDGNHAVYIANYDGVSGLWESDLQTGAMPVLVVPGSDISTSIDPAPSVSANGQYVAFTTTAALDPTNDSGGGCVDVYVRNMSIPDGQAGEYTLASALDGSTKGIGYAAAGTSGCPASGSAAALGVAISADGNQVAFTVVGASNLATGVGGATTTPAEQVAVRNLDTDTTTLVSQTMASEQSGGTRAPVPGGGVLTFDGYGNNTAAAVSTAAISADGSTVAWMGGSTIAAQAPVGPGFPDAFELGEGYDEPLWRNIAAGPTAPTRRVTGGDDPLACASCMGPLDLGYDPNGESGAVFGTYVVQNLNAAVAPELTPQLSADGQTVAFLSTQPTLVQEHTYNFGGGSALTGNLFVVNMAPGLTRDQALTPLTAWASNTFTDIETTGGIQSFSLSASGTRVAFLTDRTKFLLASPAMVSAPLSYPADAVYDVDLTADTLALASVGYDGNAPNSDVTNVSLDASGQRLAYTSGASNLVYGIGGYQDEVFYQDEYTVPAVAGQSTVSALPTTVSAAAAALTPTWRIGATTAADKHGHVTVSTALPAAGRLALSASALVPVKVKVRAKVKGRRRAVTRTVTRIRRKTIATATVTATGAGIVKATLTATRAYRRLVAGAAGLDATIAVRFTPAASKQLRTTVAATFRGRVAAATRVSTAKGQTR